MQTLAGRFCRFSAILGALCCAPVSVYADAPILSGGSAENLTLADYGDVAPIDRVHAARAFMDHEKFGFFRLGLAPLAVVQGVQVQLVSAAQLTNVLANLNAWNLSSAPLRHLEIRELEISLFGEPAPRLRAATARANPAGQLDLSLVSLPGAAPDVIARATLQITGPDAGLLRWRAGAQDKEFSVFSSTPPIKP